MIGIFHVAVGLWLFGLGAVIGSFVNVCVYRLPWQKSVIWPASHCPRCWTAIAARDNIPILSWIALRGECRRCGQPIAARYAVVEALTGTLFLAVYLTDVVFDPGANFGSLPYERMGYHQLLLAFLITASLIDFDLTIIPDEVTVPGMLLGLILGTLAPEVRPEPATASGLAAGFWLGLKGLLIGGGLTWAFRFVFSIVFRGEAMGFGDVTLMAMIGAFLGWQAAILTFFLAPFFGFGHAAIKGISWIGKKLRGQKTSRADRELIFGPYLSMAAATLMLSWPWFWPGWGSGFFGSLGQVFWYLVTGVP